MTGLVPAICIAPGLDHDGSEADIDIAKLVAFSSHECVVATGLDIFVFTTYAYAMHELLSNKLGAFGALIEERTTRALRDLSPSAAAVISTLFFRPGLTTTELARIVDVSQPTAVRLLDGLQRRGFVERGEQAGRFTPLRLTDAGRVEVGRIQRERLFALGSLLTALEGEDIRQFEILLDRVLAGATTSRQCARITCRLCEHVLCGPGICPIGNRATEMEQRGLDP